MQTKQQCISICILKQYITEYDSFGTNLTLVSNKGLKAVLGVQIPKLNKCVLGTEINSKH